jgi:hypothetical protein
MKRRFIFGILKLNRTHAMETSGFGNFQEISAIAAGWKFHGHSVPGYAENFDPWITYFTMHQTLGMFTYAIVSRNLQEAVKKSDEGML